MSRTLLALLVAHCILACRSEPADKTDRLQPSKAPAPRASTAAGREEVVPTVSMPPLQQWGGIRAVGESSTRRIGEHCSVQVTLPRLDGFVDLKAQRRLNEALEAESRALEKMLFSERPCDGARRNSPHALQVQYEWHDAPEGYAALELHASADLGEAAPRKREHCYLLRLDPPALLKLGAALTPRGRTRLSGHVTRRLREEHGVHRLSQAGFFHDALRVHDASEICWREGRIEVRFQPHEVGPPALGMQRVAFDAREISPLFDARVVGPFFGSPSPPGAN